ncbi:MAG: lysylphosphatidylglycerol synthase transmembrane domain-containing protein, partial [Candidatus Brocadiaceae bacterium]
MTEEPPEESHGHRPTAAGAGLRSRLTGYVRLALGLGLLVLLVSWVDFAEVRRALQRVAYLWVMGALAANLLFEGVCVVKLYLLGRALMPDLRFGVALKAYLVGAFFNNFLPTNVGGDVVKVSMLATAGGRWSAATAAVFVERASGVVALYCLALVAVLPPFGVLEVFGLAGARWIILGAGIATPVILVLLYVGGMKRLEGALEDRGGNRLTRFCRQLVASFLFYQSRRG